MEELKTRLTTSLIKEQFRSSVLDSKVKREADANSDHYMVKTRIRLCLNAFKIKSKLRPGLDVECLKNMEFIKKYNDCLRKKLSKSNLKKGEWGYEKILEQQKIASANSADVIPVYMTERASLGSAKTNGS